VGLAQGVGAHVAQVVQGQHDLLAQGAHDVPQGSAALQGGDGAALVLDLLGEEFHRGG